MFSFLVNEMCCLNCHVRSFSPLRHTFCCPYLPSSPSFTTVCYTRFCINAPYEFTPTPRFTPCRFRFKALGWFVSIYLSALLRGFFYDIVLIYAIFSRIQLEHKRGSCAICNRCRRRPLTFLLLTVFRLQCDSHHVFPLDSVTLCFCLSVCGIL